MTGCETERDSFLAIDFGYRVSVSAAPGGPIETKYEGAKSSFNIGGLALGEWWFQIAAFGKVGGWSEWSDPARLRVV